MTHEERLSAVGFHSGELAIQTRAGVRARAARLAPMAARGRLGAATADLLTTAQLAVLTARDTAGRLWISPLFGEPGFLAAETPTRLRIDSHFADVDPLAGAPPDQPVGLLVINFATRRRFRINGLMTQRDSVGVTIDVDQAYGNCPKYIHTPTTPLSDGSAFDRALIFSGTTLRAQDRELIERSDTFFFGTTHPGSGSDASHRGGPPGFVHTEHGRLWWPDYPGNNLFNSLGNLAVDPSAALLFTDFSTGTALQMSGSAEVVWVTDQPDDNLRTGRSVTFAPRRVIVTRFSSWMPASHERD